MLLYLVRHAIAYERDPRAWPDDAERPLTSRGQRRFRRAARGLRALKVAPDAVLSSRYARAWRTAEVLQRTARWPAPQPLPVLEQDHPAAGVLAALETYAGDGALALVGHEPQLHELASLLLAGSGDRAPLELRKGGVCAFRVEGRPAAGGGVLLWHATPKLLRAAADC